MKIDVRIPYEPGGRLGWDYNRIMEETPHDWVLFLDHDVLLALNPHWYYLCQQTIKHHRFGLATCWTNVNHRGTGQYWELPEGNYTIADHQEIARGIFNEYGESVTEIDKASGFFMLVNKYAWSKVGGFPGKGMFREDWTFCKRLRSKQWPILRMDGLYVYHMRKRIDSWIPGEIITKDIKRMEMGK